MASKAISAKSRFGSRRQPEESRAAILRAAVGEFAREGVAGARTDAIAKAAHVNKALLYYYFKDKEALYAAVLDQVFSGLLAHVIPALTEDRPPREKILHYAGAHFDYIASHPSFPRIVQSEMMRAGFGKTSQVGRIVKQYFHPLFTKVAAVLREGQTAGEFRAVDPWQFIPSMISLIVSYFAQAPVMRIMTNADPLTPQRVADRRAAVLDFISAALFVSNHKSQGAKR